jgi:hypothetical protein
MDAVGEILSEAGLGPGKLFEGRQRVAQHRAEIEASGWLIECPKSFRIVRIELKKLSNEPLRNLDRRQIHSVQSTEKSEQLKPGGFEPRAEIVRDFRR